MRERPKRPTKTFTAGAALSLALGAAVLMSSVPARAQEDDPPLDTKIFRGIMNGLGLKRDGDEKGINYGDRAPLVIPPNSTLPPPENSSAVVARNPAWPKDPEIVRAKKEAEQEKNITPFASDRADADAKVLRADQLAPGPKPREARRGDDGYVNPESGFQSQTRPTPHDSFSIFGNMFGKDQPDYASFTAEPPRTALTEPPPGYQTPSPDQPFGVSKAPPVTQTTSDYVRDHAGGKEGQ
jgi:hypothetical protein